MLGDRLSEVRYGEALLLLPCDSSSFAMKSGTQEAENASSRIYKCTAKNYWKRQKL